MLAGVGLAWAVGFGLCYLATRTQITDPNALPAFWDFAFPPRDARAPLWVVGRLLYLFANPLDYYGPLPPLVMVAPAVVCALSHSFV